MGHLPSQAHVLLQEPRAAGANVPCVGSEHLGGRCGTQQSRGAVTWGCRRDAGCPRARVRLCWSAHGGSVRGNVTCCGVHGHVLLPKCCFSCLGGLPQPLPSPPSRTSCSSSAGPPPYQHPGQGRSGCTGVSPATRDGDSVPGATVPPLSPSRCSQVKNVADGASVQDETATLAYSEKPTSPVNAPPYSAPSYSYVPPNTAYYPSGTYSSRG